MSQGQPRFIGHIDPVDERRIRISGEPLSVAGWIWIVAIQPNSHFCQALVQPSCLIAVYIPLYDGVELVCEVA